MTTAATNTNWAVDPEACEGSGLTDLCSIYDARNHEGRIVVVKKILACGCVLTREEEGVDENASS